MSQDYIRPMVKTFLTPAGEHASVAAAFRADKREAIAWVVQAAFTKARSRSPELFVGLNHQQLMKAQGWYYRSLLAANRSRKPMKLTFEDCLQTQLVEKT
jgi:hypothetical protein